ncbi:MAG: hypothetical protein NC228_01805 [[Eubacterium] siraeum]|nr:hypothetical protein [[Eubacterium] siraeum]
MRRRNCRKSKSLAAILFAAAVICLCLLSAKFTLVALAAALIAGGLWLLKC